MAMRRVTRIEMEEIWSTERLSLDAIAPESTGSKLVEMGMTNAPGKSKNFLALPRRPRRSSTCSWVK